MKPYYALLTGSKNNAGDFLIKYRGKALLSALRPDRELVDLNAWEPFDSERLRIVNGARALLLLGGPSLQYGMRPAIYPMCDDLGAITVPIVGMGIGWKSLRGEWSDTYRYPLSSASLQLLDTMAASGYTTSVRDFHTLNVLASRGYEDVLMTGCPAYYDFEHFHHDPVPPKSVTNIAFSLGVSFRESAKMLEQMRGVILWLKTLEPACRVEVVFHHALDPRGFVKTHNASVEHVRAHNRFAEWLKRQGVGYVDISGSAEALMEYYAGVDLHIGYRVHAHIFMNSISRPSILLAEDGRGKATRDVIGGVVIDAFTGISTTRFGRLRAKLGLSDRFDTDDTVLQTLQTLFAYEQKTGFSRALSTRGRIDQNFGVMQRFVEQLP